MVIYNYWYGIIFFYFSYHLGVYNEDIAILDTTMVLVFDSFDCPCHSGQYTMQEPLCLGNATSTSIWLKMVLSQIISQTS